MAAKPSRPKGARAGRVVFGSVGLAGSAAIVMALGPVWTPMPVSADVLATPMRAVENAELAAAAEAETVTPPTTAPPAPTTLPPEPELIIVEVHRRVAAGTPGGAGTTPVVSDPGSPVVGSAAPTAGAAPSPAQAQASATAPTPAPAAAAPAAPAPAPAPARTAAPAPPPPPPPAPTAPPRTSSSG